MLNISAFEKNYPVSAKTNRIRALQIAKEQKNGNKKQEQFNLPALTGRKMDENVKPWEKVVNRW